MSVRVRIYASVRWTILRRNFAALYYDCIRLTFFQEYPAVNWSWCARPSWTVRQIRDEFCTKHHIDARAFGLFNNEVELSMNWLVAEVGQTS